jgi:hypothetical protein
MYSDSRFESRDRDLLMRLQFDRDASPAFEELRCCLIWPDERAESLSSHGYELLGDLWIVRGFIHRHIPRQHWGLDPDYFQLVWTCALSDVSGWPGFRRLELTEQDRNYLQRCLQEPRSDL